MTAVRRIKLAVLAVPLLLLTACGGTESDVYDAVQQSSVESGLTEDEATKVADCATPELIDNLSDSELEQLIDSGTVTGDRSVVVDKILSDCLVEAIG